jgi:sphingomyelin phosphodiesterase acid-like 3
MLSDIHFDPFHDPGKFTQLQSAPAAQWLAIFSAPDTPTQAADFAALQKTCKAKGIDTPFALLASSLHAEQTQQPNPLFVTISGDLMAHKFDCRFQQLAPKANEADYSAFAAKTVEFLALQLHATFAHSPIYFALGNNDSGCEDYREDPDSAFLRADARSFSAVTLSKLNASVVLREFPQAGDYNIVLPAPFHNTRLVVLQDMFESRRYTACNGKPDEATGEQQIAWLRAQLSAARSAHEKVWVMAHIPPGIDPYTTFTNKQNKCGGDPEMFLGSESFANTLSDFADVIKLALFGHTHMDEMRAYSGTAGTVPAKLVPSISPVNGNNPAFTIGLVDPTTAILKDYTVFAADNQTGIDTLWSEEYRFSKTYGLPSFSGAAASKLAAAFLADKTGSTPAAQAYEHFYLVGGSGIVANVKAAAMQVVWPTYACGIAESHKDGFKACICPAQP